MSGAVPLLAVYAFVAWTGAALHLLLITVICLTLHTIRR
jgi:hypothetical protein